jgi:hypothetical protein
MRSSESVDTIRSGIFDAQERTMSATTQAPERTESSEQPRTVTRTCPNCGHHTLVAKGQLLHCRSCQQTTWRSES